MRYFLNVLFLLAFLPASVLHAGGPLKLAADVSDVVTFEMTTTIDLGPTASINPSSVSISLGEFSPGVKTYVVLPDVLYSRVAGNSDTSGLVDLNFNVAIGTEVLSQSVPYSYSAYSQVRGPGARGATADIDQESLVVFYTRRGTFTWDVGSGWSNQLGSPPGSSKFVPLSLGVLFFPVPEPSTLATASFALLSLAALRRRK